MLAISNDNNELEVSLFDKRIKLFELNTFIGDKLVDILFLSRPLAFRSSLAELHEYSVNELVLSGTNVAVD